MWLGNAILSITSFVEYLYIFFLAHLLYRYNFIVGGFVILGSFLILIKSKNVLLSDVIIASIQIIITEVVLLWVFSPILGGLERFFVFRFVCWCVIPLINFAILMLTDRQKSRKICLMVLHVSFLYALLLLVFSFLPIEATSIIFIGILVAFIFNRVGDDIRKYIITICAEFVIFVCVPLFLALCISTLKSILRLIGNI
jgi:hypothetical protein